MRHDRPDRLPALLCFAMLLLPLFPACSDDAADDSDAKFLRFIDAQEKGSRLEAAVASYENAEGVRVDLVAALHLADPKFYDRLELLFRAYDAVLYELIGPADAPRPNASQEQSLLSLFQRGMCRALELEFQLDAIDYSKPNFVHADLTAEEFMRRWEERGESFWKLVIRALEAGMQAQAEGKGSKMTPEAILEAIRSPDMAARLKRILAVEFQDIERLLAFLEPPEEGKESLILGERNAAAIRAMKEQMSLGKRKLGIFYGAGHLPDLQERLISLGFRRTEKTWFTAWDIPAVE